MIIRARNDEIEYEKAKEKSRWRRAAFVGWQLGAGDEIQEDKRYRKPFRRYLDSVGLGEREELADAKDEKLSMERAKDILKRAQEQRKKRHAV